jgi:hypothetical protein
MGGEWDQGRAAAAPGAASLKCEARTNAEKVGEKTNGDEVEQAGKKVRRSAPLGQSANSWQIPQGADSGQEETSYSNARL